MAIQITKLLRASLLKMVPVHANPEMIRVAELAREKAWRDASLIIGGIG